MKIIFKIHLFYYLFAIICILNGFFRDFVLISLIIIIHELGHITAAIYYNWKIDKVVILPFGGITIFNEILNKKIMEEFIIAIMGPIFQILLFIILKLLKMDDSTFIFYFYLILFFNLLPIYPLDGAKIINLIFSKIFPYRISLSLTLYLSYIVIIILSLYLINEYNLIFLITLLILLIRVIKEHKNIKYIYNKFLFERYIYNFKFKKNRTINNINNLYRNCKHIIKINNSYASEKTVLKNVFDK